eukprot:TRINITY_DN33560_c0_g1_i1.p1 TRINITY_DN33560_c0_g1~~TRINITY_DN33560_c0_g1_i1.p1  ORF type:complete len:275 (+),score=47.91 TRINITY_DN33560_c0_g1_i1:68-892(+)
MSCLCFSTIDAGNIGVMQTFGAFSGIQEPGCSCIMWPCVTVKPVSLAVENLVCNTETKTKDNVTVAVSATVTYRISQDNVQAAVFDIVDPMSQILAVVKCSLRSTMALLDVDETYVSKQKLSGEVETATRKSMDAFGIVIISLLITELQPDKKVVTAMNEINQAKRSRVAAIEKGDAEKTLRIKSAEADAEAKRLAGQGIAGMRVALAKGSTESREVMKQGGYDEQEASVLMMTTEYLDNLAEFAKTSNAFLIPIKSGGGHRSGLQAMPQQIGM